VCLCFPLVLPLYKQWWIKEVGRLYICPCKLQVIEGARIQGAAKIIGIDKNERKKMKGKAFGMTDFINLDESGKSISELVKEVTGEMGVDYCFECTGIAPFINEALLATKMVCKYSS
jgi:Zn-dependent alcohol dehydrogenase